MVYTTDFKNPTPRRARTGPIGVTMAHDLVQLMYISDAAVEMSDDTLVDIREANLRHNPRAGIHGALMYRSGLFLQLLEGPGAEVEKTFERICRDRRHTNIRVIARINCNQPQYLHQNMGVINTESKYSAEQGNFAHIFGLIESIESLDKCEDIVEVMNEIMAHFADPSQVA